MVAKAVCGIIVTWRSTAANTRPIFSEQLSDLTIRIAREHASTNHKIVAPAHM